MSTFDVDLRNDYGPSRDQGRRQTCLAFSASDAHAVVHSHPAIELSAEYAHFRACHRMPRFSPASGTAPDAMFAALEFDGQPTELQWPYLAALPTDLSTYIPPVVGPIFRHRGEYVPSLHAANAILQSKWPIILGLTLTASFYSLRSLSPLESDPDLTAMGKHAVLIVGLLRRATDEAYLIRNSWGPRWGYQGHAVLSKAFVEPRMLFLGAYRAYTKTHSPSRV